MVYSLEYLHLHEEKPKRRQWKQFAVCGNKNLLDRIRGQQRYPMNWRIVPAAGMVKHNYLRRAS